MVQEKKGSEISMRQQMKKFSITNMRGFQSVLVFGIGKHLGIFNYLFDKGKSFTDKAKINTVSFTLKELSEKLNLDLNYLDAWLHMSFECGIFEIDESSERTAKTSPHIFDILINRNHRYYVGGTISNFYKIVRYQERILEGFKSGKTGAILDMLPEEYKAGQQSSARVGTLTERLFAKYFIEDKEKLQNGADVLEVGCGYGFNLEIWANKYRKANFVGIDVDPNGIKHAKMLVDGYNWSDRVIVDEIPLEKYVQMTDKKFDFILLNQVLHEMVPDKNYRLGALKNIYNLLKNDGLLILCESIIGDSFAPKKEFQLYDIMHKWLEFSFGAYFYDEFELKELIKTARFKNIKLIKERGSYFWAVRKQ